MKKIVFLVLSSVLALFGQDQRHLPQGEYNCVITAMTDENWIITYTMPRENLKDTKFQIAVTSGYIATIDDKLNYKGRYSGKDVYSSKSYDSIIVPEDTYSDGLYVLGVAISNNQGTYDKFMGACISANTH